MFERVWSVIRWKHAIQENKSHLTEKWQPGLLPLEAEGCSAPLDQTVSLGSWDRVRQAKT